MMYLWCWGDLVMKWLVIHSVGKWYYGPVIYDRKGMKYDVMVTYEAINELPKIQH